MIQLIICISVSCNWFLFHRCGNFSCPDRRTNATNSLYILKVFILDAWYVILIHGITIMHTHSWFV